jgi:hypothetical protein
MARKNPDPTDCHWHTCGLVHFLMWSMLLASGHVQDHWEEWETEIENRVSC